jgi:hypothetical protein
METGACSAPALPTRHMGRRSFRFGCLSPRKRAVAASMLTAAYVILRDGVPYCDLGANHLKRQRAGVIRRFLRRLNELVYKTNLGAQQEASVTGSKST